MASGTSKEMEIKLINVARASLEELLEDYKDYLRSECAPQWKKDSREATFIRRLAGRSPIPEDQFRQFAGDRPGPVVANIAICLIHQTNFLLDRLKRHLETSFVLGGGLRERMSRARRRARGG